MIRAENAFPASHWYMSAQSLHYHTSHSKCRRTDLGHGINRLWKTQNEHHEIMFVIARWSFSLAFSHLNKSHSSKRTSTQRERIGAELKCKFPIRIERRRFNAFHSQMELPLMHRSSSTAAKCELLNATCDSATTKLLWKSVSKAPNCYAWIESQNREIFTARCV